MVLVRRRRLRPRPALLAAVLPPAAACHAHAGHDRVRLTGAAAPAGPYSPGLVVDDFVFLAGQIGKDPATGALVTGGVEAETHRAMQNLGALLAEAGLGYEHVVKTSVFLADIADLAAMNDVYASYFPAGAALPVRTTVGGAALPGGARGEIDFVAFAGR